MRKQYKRIIRKHLRSLNLCWIARHLYKYAAIPLGFRLGRPLAGPPLGTFFVTYRCNASCEFCDLPQRYARLGKELDTNRMKRILDQFRDLGTSGIGFTGGEPLVRDDIFELLRHSKNLGMHTHLNTNGLALDEKCIGRLFEIGIDSINISLDGAESRTHDRIRKSAGLFDRIMKAIQMIKERQNDNHIELTLVSVINKDNIDEIGELVQLAERVGVDGIGFMPVHPYLEKDGDKVLFSENYDPRIRRLTEYLIEKKKSSDIIDNSAGYIKLFQAGLEGKESPLKCIAGYSSIAVDCYGQVFPCMPWIEIGKKAGSINEMPLKEIWKKENYGKTRQEIEKCHMCLWNCHTEMNLLFQRFI